MGFVCPGEGKNGKNQSDTIVQNTSELTIEVVLKMIKEGKGDKDIANCFNCSARTVLRFRQKHGINRKRGGQRLNSGRKKELSKDNRDEIITYIRQGMSNLEIARMYGCTARTIINFREEYKVDEQIEKELGSLLKGILEKDSQVGFGPTVCSLAMKTEYTPKIVQSKLSKLGYGYLVHQSQGYGELDVLQRRDSCVLSFERLDHYPHETYFDGEAENLTVVAGDGNSRLGKGGARHNSHNSQVYSSIIG